jgi:hypothetical protein
VVDELLMGIVSSEEVGCGGVWHVDSDKVVSDDV